jgi:hypothetical protein
MSLSRSALVLGLLLLNACGASAVTASSAQQPSLPSATLGNGPQGNTPSSVERPMMMTERASMGGRGGHEGRTVSFSCRHCY